MATDTRGYHQRYIFDHKISHQGAQKVYQAAAGPRLEKSRCWCKGWPRQSEISRVEQTPACSQKNTTDTKYSAVLTRLRHVSLFDAYIPTTNRTTVVCCAWSTIPCSIAAILQQLRSSRSVASIVFLRFFRSFSAVAYSNQYVGKQQFKFRRDK